MITKHKQNTPALRFPEFIDEWCIQYLSTYLNFKNGINAPKESYGKGYKFINVLDIINNDFLTHESIIGSVDISENDFNKNKVEYGDILFQRSSETREEVGQSNVYLDKEIPATFGGFVIRGKNKSEYNPMFMNFLLKTSVVRKDITSRSGGSTRYNIGQDSLKKVQVHLTSKEEQNKIASFLSSVVTKIEQLAKKKSLLEQYKKGIMQKLFSQELRFKDKQGNDYPDWEEKRLGDVATFSKGKGISKADIVQDGENKCVRYGELYTEYKAVIVKVVSRTNTEKNKSKLSENNDILMPTSDVTPNGLATASALDEAGVILGGDILIIRSDEILNQYFCYHVSLHKTDIMRLVSGVTVYHIYGSDMATLKMSIPSMEEQQKTANFLSSIDQKIELIGTELKQAKTFKMGLLQQMFV